MNSYEEVLVETKPHCNRLVFAFTKINSVIVLMNKQKTVDFDKKCVIPTKLSEFCQKRVVVFDNCL